MKKSVFALLVFAAVLSTYSVRAEDSDEYGLSEHEQKRVKSELYEQKLKSMPKELRKDRFLFTHHLGDKIYNELKNEPKKAQELNHQIEKYISQQIKEGVGPNEVPYSDKYLIWLNLDHKKELKVKSFVEQVVQNDYERRSKYKFFVLRNEHKVFFKKYFGEQKKNLKSAEVAKQSNAGRSDVKDVPVEKSKKAKSQQGKETVHADDVR